MIKRSTVWHPAAQGSRADPAGQGQCGKLGE